MSRTGIAAEIDVHALRQYRSSQRSAEGPFDPVPDGFKISYQRQVLPKAALGPYR